MGYEDASAEERGEPIFFDAQFRKKPKKHGREWPCVEAPVLPVPIADTHAHLAMLRDPALALARAAAHNVAFIETMVDPASDGVATFSDLATWISKAQALTDIRGDRSVPDVRIAVGVHPHEAKLYDAEMEAYFSRLLQDMRVSAVGEIGLDYHYDLSPRPVQREVFKRQVAIAQNAGLPVILHVREAHEEAFEIMQEMGWAEAGTLLHCYTSDAEEIKRWVDAGCYIAFGGAYTFKKLQEIREAAELVPSNRLLFETDAPYMTPEPFRGTECEPAHVIFTAKRLAEQREFAEDSLEFRQLLKETLENSLRLLNNPPTKWQESEIA